jgi:hypothetical protein
LGFAGAEPRLNPTYSKLEVPRVQSLYPRIQRGFLTVVDDHVIGDRQPLPAR